MALDTFAECRLVECHNKSITLIFIMSSVMALLRWLWFPLTWPIYIYSWWTAILKPAVTYTSIGHTNKWFCIRDNCLRSLDFSDWGQPMFIDWHVSLASKARKVSFGYFFWPGGMSVLLVGRHFVWPFPHRHLRKIDWLMACTASLVWPHKYC